ncbi:hypothetical protein AB1046_17195 [Promicromonospora sp. Populi]|uniref:hypothetical protein n=1 Tax=Promicromonospora sp. Populi TaxID=3239420 RepID=UPI0034E1FF79
MARDPDDGGVFVFDLVDDETDGPEASLAPIEPGAAEEPDGDEPALRELTAPQMLSRRLRVVAPVAAVLAIVLGTGFAVDGVRDAARMERIRAVDGGVLDLSAPLEEVWEWEGRMDVDPTFGVFEVADLQGTLAFRSGDEVVGLDPASGEEAWTVPLGTDVECGPTGGSLGWAPPQSTLVCLQGAAAEREVVVVGADGVVTGPRTLRAADTREYGTPRPGPAGTVLRAERVGPRSAVDLGESECGPEGECSGTVDGGRDLVLRAEDAATGEERWRVTVPFRPTGAENCASWMYGMPWDAPAGLGWPDEAPGPDESAIDPEVFGADIGAGLIDLWGCGVQSSVTPDGLVLRTGGGAPAFGGVVVLPSGGYAGQDVSSDGQGSTSTTLFGPGGDVIGSIGGYATGPQVTDEPGAMTLLGVDGSGERLLSYAVDGTPRWNVAQGTDPSQFLAQVDGTAVAMNWMAELRGLDLATGAERWTWQPSDDLDDWSEESGGYVAQAFTDGQFLLLQLYGGNGGAGLVSLDVASGEQAWHRTDADGASGWPGAVLVAVDGHLLEVTQTGVHGLG